MMDMFSSFSSRFNPTSAGAGVTILVSVLYYGTCGWPVQAMPQVYDL